MTFVLRINFQCSENTEAIEISNILQEKISKYGVAKIIKEHEKYWKYPEHFQIFFEIDLAEMWNFESITEDLAHDWDIKTSQEAIWDAVKDAKKERFFIDNRVKWAHIENIQ